MATHRYISTTFWDDAWIQELDPSEKFVYLYLMTNPLTSISGVYKITDRRISFDTGYNADTIKNIMEKFTAAKKAVRLGELVILPSWPKHQNWEQRSTIQQGIENELKKLKDEELLFVYECGYRFPMGEILKQRKIQIKKETKDTPPEGEGDKTGVSQGYDMGMIPPSSGGEGDKASAIQSYSDLIPSEFNLDLGGNSMADPKTPLSEKPVDNSTPPPNFLQIIKEKVKAAGFYVDDPVVKKIAKTIPWPDIANTHSIIDFTVEKIREAYSDKPEPERKKLFISALTSWGNIRDEYPDWLLRKQQTDERQALELLRNTPPKICPHCGEEMNKTHCPKCQGYVLFSDEHKAWEYQEYVDFSFSDFLKKKGGQEEEKQEDVDF